MIAIAIIETMAEANNASDHSLLWGYALEFWDRVGIWSLVAGAIVGVGALLLTAASAYILYRVADAAQVELASETKRSSVKIEEANAKLGIAQADITKAQARIAEAEARTKEAELKLEQLRKSVRPRGFGMEFFDLVKDEPGCPVRISYVDTAGDGASLATQLTFMLPKEKGWVVGVPEPITAREQFIASSAQGFFRSDDFIAPENTMIGTGINPPGISVVIGPGFEQPADSRGWKTGATPVGALIRAFLASVGNVSYGFDGSLPVGTLRVVIGPKP